jgi:hypothetical protein
VAEAQVSELIQVSQAIQPGVGDLGSCRAVSRTQGFMPVTRIGLATTTDGELLIDCPSWTVAGSQLGAESTPCELLEGALAAVPALGARGPGKAKRPARRALGRCRGLEAVTLRPHHLVAAWRYRPRLRLVADAEGCLVR